MITDDQNGPKIAKSITIQEAMQNATQVSIDAEARRLKCFQDEVKRNEICTIPEHDQVMEILEQWRDKHKLLDCESIMQVDSIYEDLPELAIALYDIVGYYKENV